MEGKTALEIVSSTAEADGVYMVGDAVIEVKGGVPTQIKYEDKCQHMMKW